jgi:phosphoserine aminotransferase
MISFYPGPSRVHDKIPAYVKDAFRDGVMSINHRSETFMDICKTTVMLLHEKLKIPRQYQIYFTSSASECLEIIAQSLYPSKSYHFYSGAFGEKWYDYTRRLRRGATARTFSMESGFSPDRMKKILPGSLLCFTQNETSNGTQVPVSAIRSVRKMYPDSLIAVDATSSMAGISLNMKVADIWYASVQKCFGLPAGLGIMICSPRALKTAADIGERKHYNSLLYLQDMMGKWQTTCTPNVLSIYLLMRVLKDSKEIAQVHLKTEARYREWIEFLSQRNSISHLIDNKSVHSYTVIPVKSTPEITASIKAAAKQKDILLGEGYGSWKGSTFRIANFPAIKGKEIKKLMRFLEEY